MQPLAQRLREARKRRGLSHERLAGATGNRVSRQSLMNIENGKQIPGADTLLVIAQALGESVDWLLGLEWNGVERRVAAGGRR
jgi:transcriptional regulator with XRE-family HTH domain